MDLKRLKQNLSDAGCCKKTTEDVIRMCESGNMAGALQVMRKDRCRLMDELHESGRKVDCLDFLIRPLRVRVEDFRDIWLHRISIRRILWRR